MNATMAIESSNGDLSNIMTGLQIISLLALETQMNLTKHAEQCGEGTGPVRVESVEAPRAVSQTSRQKGKKKKGRKGR